MLRVRRRGRRSRKNGRGQSCIRYRSAVGLPACAPCLRQTAGGAAQQIQKPQAGILLRRYAPQPAALFAAHQQQAAARVCSPSPYSAGARLVRNCCTARCSCCGVLLCSATSVSAPRVRQCTVPCQVSGRVSTAFCTVCSGTPNSRSTQPVGRSSLFVMTHPPCGRRGRPYSARRVSSKAVRAAGSCCALSVSTCVPAGVLPCASRSASSSAVCAARARMSARSGRETNSFFT